MRLSRFRRTRSQELRIVLAVVVLAAVGTVTATVVSAARNSQADAATQQAFVRIQDVQPNVVTPKRLAGASSTASFIQDCGTNANKKFSPDNPVAQPGIKNGAEHVHDFVGNLSTSADSTDESLAAADTTCKNKDDKSTYFWPVVRIDTAPVADSGKPLPAQQAGDPTIVCPTVADKLPAVPASAMAEVQRNLQLLDQQIAEANQRLISTKGQGGPNFVNNAILGPLKDKRVATIDRIAIAIGRTAARPTNLGGLAECDLSFDKAHNASHAPTTAAAPANGSTGNVGSTSNAATPTVNCPTVRDKLPGIPASALDEVNRNLALLDTQIAEANQRIVSTQGQGGPNFIQNAILGPLRDKRVATIDRIAIAIGRSAAKPTNLGGLATCSLNNAAGGNNNNGGGANNGGATAAPAASATAKVLQAPSGPNFELPGNAGVIQRPVFAKIEYRGNPTTKVVPMPKFLRELTGDAKPTSRGPANARKAWTCSGFENRLTDKYVICPQGSLVERIDDFPGCWDGKNTDSANHRTHVAFADVKTGACPAGFKAIPQLRITIAYNIPVNIQKNKQYALDAFPEENHNPFSEHNDFINVNSEALMQRITNCINTGQGCQSGGVGPSGSFALRGLGSGRCLDIKAASRANGARAQIFDCHGGVNQSFTSTPAGELRTFNGAKCLDVTARGTANGTPVQIFDCNGGSNQKFKLNSDGTIVAVGASKCLDVDRAATGNGGKVQIFDCNGGANQRWTAA